MPPTSPALKLENRKEAKMTKLYCVISIRNFNWGEDRRDMFFTSEEAAELAAHKVRKKFADENIDGEVKIITRTALSKDAAKDTELVHCILH